MLKRLFEVIVIWPLVVILIPILIVVATVNYVVTGENMLLAKQQKRKWQKKEFEKEIKNQLN